MRTQAVSFPKNIYHYCQRNFVDSDLLNIRYRRRSRRLGALPYDWLKDKKSDYIPKLTVKVDKLFRQFAGRDSLDSTSIDKFKLEQKLSKLLHRDDVKVSFVNVGGFKKCYKLTVGDYSYAFLTFRKENRLEEATFQGHGALVEPCRIFDFYREYSHGRVVKPFMTRFVNNTHSHDYDGYMLVKFVDENDTARAKCDLPEIQRQFYPYRMTDYNDGNVINGIIVDIGRLLKNYDALPNGEFRQKVYSFLIKIERNNEENYIIPKLKEMEDANEAAKITSANKRAEEFIYILMKNGVDIYNIDLREFIQKEFNSLEQKFIIKKIRALKKLHNLKLKVQQSGEYEECKKYFEEYAQRCGSWTLKAELFGFKRSGC